MEPKIAIIGAGLSGLGAASRLQEAGYSNYTVFEATDRIGGRVHTCYFKDSSDIPYKIEFGAEWIHGTKDNPLYNIAKQHNLLQPLSEHHVFQSVASPWACSAQNPRVLKLCTKESVLPDIHNNVEETLNNAIAECRKLSESMGPGVSLIHPSVGNFINSYFMKHYEQTSNNHTELRQMIFEQKLSSLNFYEACDNMSEVTLEGYHKYEDLEGDEPKVSQGSISIVKAISANIPRDKIVLNCPTVCFQYAKPDSNKVKVKFLNNARADEYFDCIIVTCSVAVLQSTCDTLFDPPLPSFKLAALHHLKLGIVNKVYFEFDDIEFLPLNIDRLELFWSDDDRKILPDWTWKISVVDIVLEKHCRNILVIWLAGQVAEKIEHLSEEVIKADFVKMLRHFLQHASIPLPKQILRSSWHSHPYIRGSYSFSGLEGKLNDREDLASPLIHPITKKPIIMFAGEATNPRHYSTMHGALLSGWREAKRIITIWPLAKI